MTESTGGHIESSDLQWSDDGVRFDCPRCAARVEERFYGPCRSCRAQLVEALGGPAREVDVARFEPPMHVTPNAVATKD